MARVVKPHISALTLGKNPYRNDLEIEVYEREAIDKFIYQDGLLLNDVITMEDNVVRLYIDKENKSNVLLMHDNSCKMLLWVLMNLEPNKEYFWLNKKRYISEVGVSYNTYLKSINQLVDLDVIIPTKIRDVYWVNPKVMFKGNRIKMFKRHVVKR